MKTYETISGDTWDLIAYNVYGDEFLCDYIVDANPDKLDYAIFPSGVVLSIPDLEAVDSRVVATDSPTWRELINKGDRKAV